MVAAFQGQRDPLLSASKAVAAADRAMERLPRTARLAAGLARQYLELRENQRYHFDRLLWEWKLAWRWLEDAHELDLR